MAATGEQSRKKSLRLYHIPIPKRTDLPISEHPACPSRADENSSGLQAIKGNPSKPSMDAMLTLLDKLRVIKATGVLGLDLSWLRGNYRRALFHHLRKTSVTRLREASRGIVT